MKVPFAISCEAEKYIREIIERASPEGMERSLNLAFRLSVRDKDGKLIERCDRENYFFGSSPPDKHTDHTHYDLFGHVIAIHPDTIESLRGKCLSIGQTDKIEGIDRTRDVLVATPIDVATSQI